MLRSPYGDQLRRKVGTIKVETEASCLTYILRQDRPSYSQISSILSSGMPSVSDKISRKTDIVIRSRIAGMLGLGQKELAVLEEELYQGTEPHVPLGASHPPCTDTEHLSYAKKNRLEVRNIPQTVYGTYEKIMSRS